MALPKKLQVINVPMVTRPFTCDACGRKYKPPRPGYAQIYLPFHSGDRFVTVCTPCKGKLRDELKRYVG